MNHKALALGALVPLLSLGCDASAAVDAGFDAPSDATRDVAAVDSSMRTDAWSADPLGAFCTPLAMNLCRSAMTCGCGDILPGGLDVMACAARFEADCRSAWEPFVLAGAVFDPVAGAACAATIEANSLPCAAPSGVAAFALCAPFAVDPAGMGEDCAAPYCAGGDGYCQGNSCVPRGVAGSACNDMFSCGLGLVCNEGMCTALVDAGGACTSDFNCRPPLSCVAGMCGALREVGASCAGTSECARGLVCTASVCTARTGTSCGLRSECGNLTQCAEPPSCRAPLPSGSACVVNADCAAELYCDDTSRTCVPRPAIGLPCGNNIHCAAGAGCNSDGPGGTCRALGENGDQCLFDEFGPFACASGLACSAGTCRRLPTEGEPCAGVDICAPGLGCAFGPKGSFCVIPGVADELCENRQACRADHHCAPSGTCQPDVAIGEPCSPSLGDCEGACIPDRSGGFTCRARVAEGDTCLVVSDCAPGLTCLVRSEDTRCIADICTAL